MAAKRVFNYHTSLDHYTADAFVVRCFDNRFWKVFKEFIKNQKINHIDVESVAGGAKIFASPEYKTDQEYLFRELEKSIKLHHSKKVMLFTHHDCGAYGGLKKFAGDKKNELAFHTKELLAAKDSVQNGFPKLKIESYFIDEKGAVQIS